MVGLSVVAQSALLHPPRSFSTKGQDKRLRQRFDLLGKITLGAGLLDNRIYRTSGNCGRTEHCFG
jgi:hypothetical protein